MILTLVTSLSHLKQCTVPLFAFTSRLYMFQIFELETEVEKLHQNLEKETTKKDTATQALRDGLAIAKTKKKEYEEKLKEIEKENALALKAYEEKVADLMQEMETLKSEKKINGGKTLVTAVHCFLLFAFADFSQYIFPPL